MGPAASAVYVAIEKAKTRMNSVYQEALVLLADTMQKPVTEGGNMPTKTGFLRSSFEVSVDGSMPALVPHPGGEAYSYDPGPVHAKLRTATVRKHKASMAWAAEYAGHVEHNYRFRDLGVQQWPALVAKANAIVSTRP